MTNGSSFFYQFLCGIVQTFIAPGDPTPSTPNPDGEDLSTPELIKLIASSMGRKAKLFPLPIFMLKFLGSVVGKSEEINRLVGSLRIDNSYTKKILDWTPPLNVEEGIRRMVQGK